MYGMAGHLFSVLARDLLQGGNSKGVNFPGAVTRGPKLDPKIGAPFWGPWKYGVQFWDPIWGPDLDPDLGSKFGSKIGSQIWVQFGAQIVGPNLGPTIRAQNWALGHWASFFLFSLTGILGP